MVCGCVTRYYVTVVLVEDCVSAAVVTGAVVSGDVVSGAAARGGSI